MADLDLWAKDSMLSNFADDTQSIIISECKESLLDVTTQEAYNIMNLFFGSNNSVNHAERAAILYNSNGKGKDITIENIGGEKLKSTSSKKLLRIYIHWS